METLIYFDKSSYERTITSYKLNIPLLQSVIDAYNSMQLPALNNDDFQRLFTETNDLIFDKMTAGETLHIAGLKLHKDKAFEILHKPDGYEAFANELENALKIIKQGNGNALSVLPQYIKNYYELDELGNVAVKASFIKQIEKQYKRYVTSDAANSVFQFANFVIDKCNELGLTAYAKHDPNGFGSFIEKIIEGGAGKELQIKAKGVLEYNNK